MHTQLSPTGMSEEQFLADQLLDAYDEADQEKLDLVTRNQTFAFLQNDVAVLARKLTAEGGTGNVLLSGDFLLSVRSGSCALLACN